MKYFIDLDDTLFNTQHIKNTAHPRICAEVKETDNSLREVKAWPRELRLPAEKIIDECIQTITLFPRMQEFLATKKKEDLFLITFGPQERQQKKIEVLGLEHIFCELRITQGNKKEVFLELLEKYDLQPAEVTVIGDKLEDEIAIGKALGCAVVVMKDGVVVEGTL